MEDHAKAAVMTGINAMTDFSNPVSIMNTAALMLQTALNLYSIVLIKEDLHEVLDMAQKKIDNNNEDTVYH
tara:strand:+ start:180 stop:392 length:213 start_codon:yes stop_codon:yes gene_type:complete